MFGRTPALSWLELQAVLPAYGVTGTPLWQTAEMVVLERNEPWTPAELTNLQDSLGGTVRIVELLESVREAELIASLVRLVEQETELGRKLNLGINCWSIQGKIARPTLLARQLKQVLAAKGQSVRMVIPPVPRNQLSAAQLLHNRLLGSRAACDLVVMTKGGQYEVGLTRTVQDIAAYTIRDFGIPKPDALSGMLPPKLAQIMLNLAVGADRQAIIYDPFCGNGRLLLEAALLGLDPYGSDLEPVKVKSAIENLVWMVEQAKLGLNPAGRIWLQDAQLENARSALAAKIQTKPWYLVAEGFLGKPLRSALSDSAAKEWRDDLMPLYLNFFSIWSAANCPVSARPKGLLVALPRVVSATGEVSVFENLVDRLKTMGYSAEVLFCYNRPDALVRRDLVKITYR